MRIINCGPTEPMDRGRDDCAADVRISPEERSPASGESGRRDFYGLRVGEEKNAAEGVANVPIEIGAMGVGLP